MDPARSSCTEGVVGMETGLTVNPSARQCVEEGLDKEYPGLCREAAVLATSNHLCLVLAKQHWEDGPMCGRQGPASLSSSLGAADPGGWRTGSSPGRSVLATACYDRGGVRVCVWQINELRSKAKLCQTHSKVLFVLLWYHLWLPGSISYCDCCYFLVGNMFFFL